MAAKKNPVETDQQVELKQDPLKEVYKCYKVPHGDNLQLISAIAKEKCPDLLKPIRRKTYFSGQLNGLWMGLLPLFKAIRQALLIKLGKEWISENDTADLISKLKILNMKPDAISHQVDEEKRILGQRQVDGYKRVWKRDGIVALVWALVPCYYGYPCYKEEDSFKGKKPIEIINSISQSLFDKFRNMTETEIEQFLNSEDLLNRSREVMLNVKEQFCDDDGNITNPIEWARKNCN